MRIHLIRHAFVQMDELTQLKKNSLISWGSTRNPVSPDLLFRWDGLGRLPRRHLKKTFLPSSTDVKDHGEVTRRRTVDNERNRSVNRRTAPGAPRARTRRTSAG